MQTVGPQRGLGGKSSKHRSSAVFAEASQARGSGLPWDAESKGAIMNIPERACQESSFPLGEEEARRESEEERRKIRRLQLMMSMVMSVISQDPSLTVEEASELAAGAKRAALAMFPDKELAYDLLYKPRVQRLMKERFRLQ
jgi:hypothetical protein